MNLKLHSSSLILGLSCLCVASLQAQNIIYQEDWSTYANNASVIGNGYRFANPIAPSDQAAHNNSAVVHHDSSGNYLSVLSYGYDNINKTQAKPAGDNPSWSPQVRTATTFTPIALSSEYVTRISLDMRYQSPDPAVPLVNGGSTPYSSFRFSGAGGAAWFGFFGSNKVFAGAGGNAATIANFDPTNWYRFTLDLDPLAGSMVLTVFELDALGNTTEVASLLSTNTGVVTSLNNYTFELVRPGTTTTNVWSADFANLSVTTLVPEPSTVAALLGGGVFALALGVRSLRRRGASAPRS